MKIETHPASDLGKALAGRVAEDLRAALAKKGRASIAVSGGSTPAPFLAALSAENLDWANVSVTLTDERQVTIESDRSNARLVAQNLLRGAAADAQFIPLYEAGQDIAETGKQVAASIVPLDVCVLGMGDDMHTASLFPGTPGLAGMLDSDGSTLVALASPPTADEPRVTLTAAALTTAAHTYLLIKGAGKRTALDQAMSTTDLLAAPVRAILDASSAPVVFYAD